MTLAAALSLAACRDDAPNPNPAITTTTTTATAATSTAAPTASTLPPAPPAVPSAATPATSAELPKPPEDHDASRSAAIWRPTHVGFAPKSDALVATGDGKALLVTSLRSTPRVVPLPSEAPVMAAAFLVTGERLALWRSDGSVALVDGDGTALSELPKPTTVDTTSDWTLRWSGDGRWLAGAEGEHVHVWKVSDGVLHQSLQARAFNLGFGYDGHRLAAATTFAAWVWDAHTGRLLEERSTRTGGTFGTEVSPDANWVASAEVDGHGATLYKTRPWQLETVLVSDTTCDAHIAVSFSSDSRHVFAHGGGRWVRGYRVDTKLPFMSFDFPHPGSWSRVSDDGKTVLVAADDGARIYDVPGKQLRATIEGSFETIAATLSPDGRFAAAADTAQGLRLWSTADAKLLLAVPFGDESR
ncbi:MAG: hypothetical protein R3B72_09145 [Polyangiaceae bacterium]